jgi:hypothetical protein
MGTPAPDAVKRLVDRFDQDRKVFQSGDYQAGTGDWGLGTWDPNPNPKPLAPNPSCFMPVIHEESINDCPKRSEVPNYLTVDFGALWRYISLHYEENHGHNCSPR